MNSISTSQPLAHNLPGIWSNITMPINYNSAYADVLDAHVGAQKSDANSDTPLILHVKLSSLITESTSQPMKTVV